MLFASANICTTDAFRAHEQEAFKLIALYSLNECLYVYRKTLDRCTHFSTVFDSCNTYISTQASLTVHSIDALRYVLHTKIRKFN